MLLVHLISPWSICRVSPVGFEVKLLDYSSGSSGPQSMWHPKPLRLYIWFYVPIESHEIPMKSSLTPHEIPIQAHQLPTSSLPTPSRIPGPVWLGYLWRAATRRWGPLPRFTWRGDRWPRPRWRTLKRSLETWRCTTSRTQRARDVLTSCRCMDFHIDEWGMHVFLDLGTFFFGPEWYICTHTFGNRGKLCTVKSVKNSCSMLRGFGQWSARIHALSSCAWYLPIRMVQCRLHVWLPQAVFPRFIVRAC